MIYQVVHTLVLFFCSLVLQFLRGKHALDNQHFRINEAKSHLDDHNTDKSVFMNKTRPNHSYFDWGHTKLWLCKDGLQFNYCLKNAPYICSWMNTTLFWRATWWWCLGLALIKLAASKVCGLYIHVAKIQDGWMKAHRYFEGEILQCVLWKKFEYNLKGSCISPYGKLPEPHVSHRRESTISSRNSGSKESISSR